MNRRPLDLHVTLAMGALAALLALDHAAATDDATRALALAVEIPSVLLLPGYALVGATISPRHIPLWHQLLAGLGSSLALVILGGMLLNLLPAGLTATTWGLWLGGVTLAAAAIGLARGHGRPLLTPRWPGRAALAPCALLTLAALVTAGAGALAVADASGATQRAPSVDLWALPAPDEGGYAAVTVGIDTYDGAGTQTFRLTITVAGVAAVAVDPIALGPNAHWQQTLSLPASATGVATSQQRALQLVAIQLWRAGDTPTAYRHVSLWLAGTSLPASPR